jgi:hypothetical protein
MSLAKPAQEAREAREATAKSVARGTAAREATAAMEGQRRRVVQEESRMPEVLPAQTKRAEQLKILLRRELRQ